MPAQMRKAFLLLFKKIEQEHYHVKMQTACGVCRKQMQNKKEERHEKKNVNTAGSPAGTHPCIKCMRK